MPDSNVVVSYRDDSFAPMVDLSIQVFNTNTVGSLTDDGNCPTATAGQCAWSDDDEFTGDGGNILVPAGVTDEDNTYYAWASNDDDDDNNEFDADDANAVSVTLSYAAQALGIRVTADTNDEVGGDGTTSSGHPVNLDKGDTVVLTAQLIDTEAATDDSADVAKSGVEITVNWAQTLTGGSLVNVYPAPDELTTDENGQVTFTITGPASTDDETDDPDRLDTVTFTGDVDGDGTDDQANNEEAALSI